LIRINVKAGKHGRVVGIAAVECGSIDRGRAASYGHGLSGEADAFRCPNRRCVG